MPRLQAFLVLAAAVAALHGASALGQGTFTGSRDHPAIQYSSRPTRDVVAALNRRLEDGRTTLTFDGPGGYLRSLLAALDISSASQMLVFSESSVQASLITKATPRALYFNDTAAVGWVKGAATLEVAAHDPEQGVVFYTVEQKPQAAPRLARAQTCLQCHLNANTSGVPGLLAMSMLPLSDNKHEYAQGWAVDHRTPIEDRWGGWYVTGSQVPQGHLGNVPVHHVPRSYVREPVAPKLETAAGPVDAGPYLTPHSDVVALLVANHQFRMTNLITRLGWEARAAASPAAPAPRGDGVQQGVRDAVSELVDYLLFVDEAELTRPAQGLTPFAREFEARGPKDTRGRSLRTLDLTRRLLRYPCSYMIYSEAFDALPEAARRAVYERMWEILSGSSRDAAHARLAVADRRAIVEILRETKKGLPAYFQLSDIRR